MSTRVPTYSLLSNNLTAEEAFRQTLEAISCGVGCLPVHDELSATTMADMADDVLVAFPR